MIPTEKKEWMIVFKKRDAILLHQNEDLLQYRKLKRVDRILLNKLIKTSKIKGEKLK